MWCMEAVLWWKYKIAIPSDLTKLTGLEQLWLDGNALTGPIPDFTGCLNLKIIHLENNQLSGDLPSSLPNLSQLYVQNNLLTGDVPSSLLNKNLVLNCTGNVNLGKGGSVGGRNRNIIIGLIIGDAALLLGLIASCLLLRQRKKFPKTGIYRCIIFCWCIRIWYDQMSHWSGRFMAILYLLTWVRCYCEDVKTGDEIYVVYFLWKF